MTREDVERLNRSLASPDKEEMARALAELETILRANEGDASSLEPLGSHLGDSDPSVRRLASWLIGKSAQNKLAGQYPVARLRAALSDADDEVRENSAWAFGEMAGVGIGDKALLMEISNLFSDDAALVRGMAAWAVGRYAEKLGIVVPLLVEALKGMRTDESPMVCSSAKWALEQIRAIRKV